jgi:hypothetical protein
LGKNTDFNRKDDDEDDPGVLVLDFDTLEPVLKDNKPWKITFDDDLDITEMALSPCKRHLAFANLKGKFKLMDTKTFTILLNLEGIS